MLPVVPLIAPVPVIISVPVSMPVPVMAAVSVMLAVLVITSVAVGAVVDTVVGVSTTAIYSRLDQLRSNGWQYTVLHAVLVAVGSLFLGRDLAGLATEPGCNTTQPVMIRQQFALGFLSG